MAVAPACDAGPQAADQFGVVNFGGQRLPRRGERPALWPGQGLPICGASAEPLCARRPESRGSSTPRRPQTFCSGTKVLACPADASEGVHVLLDGMVQLANAVQRPLASASRCPIRSQLPGQERFVSVGPPGQPAIRHPIEDVVVHCCDRSGNRPRTQWRRAGPFSAVIPTAAFMASKARSSDLVRITINSLSPSTSGGESRSARRAGTPAAAEGVRHGLPS